MPLPQVELEEAIAEGDDVTLIVGAGVTIQATDGAPTASWTGLLLDGADVGQQLDAAFRTKMYSVVVAQIKTGDPDNMLSAAETISSVLGGPGGRAYGTWLWRSIGQLKVTRPEVLEAVGALRRRGALVATTNYDDLLAKHLGLPPVTWRDPWLEEVVRYKKGVIHLHGHWNRPESIVFGRRTYDEIVGDEFAQLALRALRFGKTMVFIGCGAGLEDPNFERFRQWLVRMSSPYPSFRLCLESQVEELRLLHDRENVHVIPYGSRVDDLAPFLSGLATSAAKRTLNAAAVPPSPPAARAALPAPPARCLGREEEVERVVGALLMARTKPLPILGPPGVGKSTVALSALYHPAVVVRFGARRYFVRCDGLGTAAALVESLTRYMGVPASEQVEDGLQRVLAELAAAAAPVALVLDNLETPWELDRPNVEDALARLASIPDVSLVATQRGRERTPGVDWAAPVNLEPFSIDYARQTFLAIAGDRFESDPNLDALLEDVDRLPLVVSLMAHFAEPEPNLKLLRERWMTFLGASDPSDSLALSLELSMTSPRLKAEARRLLQVLACLPAGLWNSDVRTLIGDDAPAALNSARRCGLIEYDGERVRMLSPIREHVSKHHKASLEDRAALHSFFLGLALQGNQVGYSSGRSVLERLTPEAANIDRVLSDIVDSAHEPLKDVVDAVLAWGKFVAFTRSGEVSSLPKAIALTRASGDLRGEATLLQRFGDIARARGAGEDAEASYWGALEKFKMVPSTLGMANCLHCLGDVAFQRSVSHRERSTGPTAHLDRSLELYKEALKLYQLLPERPTIGEANCLSRIGEALRHRKQVPEAVDHFEKALELNKALQYVHGQAWCLEMLGRWGPSDIENRRDLYRQALDLHRRGGATLGEANCWYALGELANTDSSKADSDELANVFFERALSLYQVVPDPLSVGRCHMHLGKLTLNAPETRQQHFDLARVAFEGREDLLARLTEYEKVPGTS